MAFWLQYQQCMMIPLLQSLFVRTTLVLSVGVLSIVSCSSLLGPAEQQSEQAACERSADGGAFR